MGVDDEIQLMTTCPSGGLAKGGHPDHPDGAEAGGYPQRAGGGDPRRASNLEPAHPQREEEGPGLLHVPDQHQRHEEQSRLHSGPRYAGQSCSLVEAN